MLAAHTGMGGGINGGRGEQGGRGGHHGTTGAWCQQLLDQAADGRVECLLRQVQDEGRDAASRQEHRNLLAEIVTVIVQNTANTVQASVCGPFAGVPRRMLAQDVQAHEVSDTV